MQRQWFVATLAAAGLATGCGVDEAPEQTLGSQSSELRSGLSTDGRYHRKVISTGAEFHASNGIFTGPHDRLYVASVLSRSISIVDSRSGRILDRIGPERGVESPDDLCIGPDGSLYWASYFTGEVGRLLPDGTKRTLGNIGMGANPVTITEDGSRLFVGRAFLADELWEIDPEGVAAPRLVVSNLGGVNAFDIGPDGALYSPLWFKGQVVRIDVDTGAATPVITGLDVPAAVKFDAQGRLHVVDQLRGQVLRLEADGSLEVVGQSPEPGLDNLAFDSRGRIFVTNSHDGYLRVFEPNGHTRLLTPGGLVAPGGLGVLERDGREEVFVGDSLSMKAIDGRSGRILDEAHAIIGVTPLASPLTVATDGDRLITTSWFGRAVQIYDPQTEQVLETHRDFAVPLNAVRFGEDLVVAELTTHSVIRKHADGTKQTLARLPVPTGLAASGEDLYAADWATGAVVQLIAGGELLATPRMIAGLSKPEGLALDVDGTLLAVETGLQRLVRIDPATGEVTVVQEELDVGLTGPSTVAPTYIFNGVAVGNSGNIYVTLDVTNQLLRLRPHHGHGH